MNERKREINKSRRKQKLNQKIDDVNKRKRNIVWFQIYAIYKKKSLQSG